jgi:hypothetical protein
MMSEERRSEEADQDPQPVKESDAERVTGEQAADPRKIEGDPAENPPEGVLRDVKGG